MSTSASRHEPRPSLHLLARVLFICLVFGMSGRAVALTYHDTTVTMAWVDPAMHTDVAWSKGANCTSYAGAPVDDDISAPVNLGFTFGYGAASHTQVQIMSNGRLQFGNPFCGFGTQTTGPPPTYANPYKNGKLNNTLRIYGADLDPSAKGSGTTCVAPACTVRYTATPLGTAPNRRFVVTWSNVPEWGKANSYFNLQVILNEDGSFIYQFGAFNNPSGGKAQSGWQLSLSDFFVRSTGPQPDGTAVKYAPATVAPSGLGVVEGAAIASTCSSTTLTVSALDSAGNVVTSYAGTVQLSTSTGHGNWSVASATGTLSAGAADSGNATYTFNGAGSGKDNGTAVLRLANAHADVLTVTGADAAVSGLADSSGAITFNTNALVLTATDALGSTAVAGRNHAFKAEFWQQDAASGACVLASGYTGTRTLDAWVTRDASDPGGAAPTIGGVALPGAAAGGKDSDNLALAFTAGSATFSLATSDVGKYVLNLRDDSRAFASGEDIAGTSATLTVRPFALSVESVSAGAVTNPAASAASGAVFTTAGGDFSASVRAVLWQAADDPSNSGAVTAGANLVDNAVAPSYAWATTLTPAAPFTPATGVLGTLNNGVIAQAAFVGGKRSVTTLQYTEVGSASLAATAVNYLGSAGVNLASPAVVVGRFTPASFSVAYNTPAFSAGCPAGGFTYLGAPFTYRTAPILTVTARNALGQVTRNYTGSFWKLSNASLTGKLYAAASGNLNTAALPATDPVITDLGDGIGTLSFSSGGVGLAFDRGPPSAPFDAEISLAINVIDSDGVRYAANPARFGAASAGNGIAFDDGSALTAEDKQMLWGRLRFASGFGSELLPVAVQARAETLSAIGSFVTNAADNCTALPATALTLANNVETKAAGETSIRITAAASSTAAIANGGVRNGVSLVTFSAPGAGNTGYAGLLYSLATAASPWLRFDWSGTGSHDQDPGARADFGMFSGPRTVIYTREPW